MRQSKLALLFSTALFAHAAAQAGEVTLFSGPNLTGRESTARGDIGNLERIGFNDRAMSLVVHSGRWEVCTDADFRGECRVYDAGPQRGLDRFTGQISSIRALEEDRGRGRGRGRNRGEPTVMLYDQADLRGRSVSLNRDANNFVPLGINDAVQSMVIRGGTWEFCQHSDFRGECRVFEPGQYRNLDRAFHRAISSARLVGDGRQDQRAGYSQRDGYSSQNDGYGQGGDGVELFTSQGFGGQRLPVRDEIRSLEELNFNDRVGSLVVHSGQWEFCQHAEFRGQCMVYGPGRYDRLGGMHNAISSLRRVR